MDNRSCSVHGVHDQFYANGQCRKCDKRRAYMQKYRQERPERHKSWKRSYIAKCKEVVNEAKSKPCADCGNSYHYCAMDFDHRPGEEKNFGVSTKRRKASPKALMEEISKCDVVCANCHRLRTFKRLMEEYHPSGLG